MLEEEIQDRKRFLKVSSERIWSISEKDLEEWVIDILQVVTQNYGKNFMLKVSSELEPLIKQTSRVELVTTALINLQKEGLDDNYFAFWIDFLEKEERNNLRSWRSSKGIDLVD